MKEIDTMFNNSPVCPHCGFENEDHIQYNEIDGDEENVSCPSCGNDYVCEMNIQITYNSYKIS